MRQLIAIFAITMLAACGGEDSSPPTTSSGTTVLTTFYPVQYFAERIAGEYLTVECPLPTGADPASWRPDGLALQRYQSADLILINGAGFEKWLTTASLPDSRIIDTSKSFQGEFIHYQSEPTHKHGEAGDEHNHTGIDGHTWLDPINAKAQAGAILKAFEKKWPAHAAAFQRNFQTLAADLDSLDAELKKIRITQALLASHPAYNYLARRYTWELTNLHLDPVSMPAPDAIPANHPAKILLWESEPSDVIASRLKKSNNLNGIVFSPAESPSDLDYLATMRANLVALTGAIEASQ